MFYIRISKIKKESIQKPHRKIASFQEVCTVRTTAVVGTHFILVSHLSEFPSSSLAVFEVGAPAAPAAPAAAVVADCHRR